MLEQNFGRSCKKVLVFTPLSPLLFINSPGSLLAPALAAGAEPGWWPQAGPRFIKSTATAVLLRDVFGDVCSDERERNTAEKFTEVIFLTLLRKCCLGGVFFKKK